MALQRVALALWGTQAAAAFVGSRATFRGQAAGSLASVEEERKPVDEDHRNPFDTQVPIVVSEANRTWWGNANYNRDLDHGSQTWAEIARVQGQYGSSCTAQNTLAQCGDALVCRRGYCLECMLNKECGESFRCTFDIKDNRRMCVPRDLKSQWHWREVICTLLIVVTAMLSAAAGMGGGGVYVPLCLLLLGLSVKEAIPLSQAMILGGAVVNVVMFCGDRHPQHPERPKIDYDVLMMLNPGLAAGVTLGVICHMISPQWLTILILVLTLVLALQKSLVKGLQAWAKESAQLAQAAQGGIPAQKQSIEIKTPDLRAFLDFASTNYRSLGLIGSCWGVFFIMNLVKAPSCTPMYWSQLLAMVGICVVFTVAGGRLLAAQKTLAKHDGGEELQWTPTTLWLYPVLTTVAGFLGGFLGIGGGIVLGPLLLELGLHPEANQATTAMFVFLSSSLATLQFMMLGKGMPQFVIWFTVWVVAATLVGQTAMDYVIKRWQRTSLIVLSIAGIVACSLLMMTIVGGLDIVRDVQRGADMGFKPHQLCMR